MMCSLSAVIATPAPEPGGDAQAGALAGALARVAGGTVQGGSSEGFRGSGGVS